ncbi:MAG: exodeoxyribonuclease VII large subunit [Candidatus Eisenbacteria bacterium]|nr:exodeoxyribonuclease VII large subunit [Candidatus Eisenbacteria bacterium]
MSAPADSRRVYTVTEINTLAQRVLHETFPSVRVGGEISGFHHHSASGHMYFDLKDGRCVLRCALFKANARRLRFRPADGLQVEATGRLTIYETRGSYQLVVDELAESGLGELQRRFEELKARLQAEGLFDEARKRPLPRYPARLGVVTSAGGAVLHDIVHVARRRWPGIRIILCPVQVQGAGAAADVARGVELFNRAGAADVLIVARGGGSLEDLWAFNEESVVRAVAASAIPVVSAVGHETDVTLCDFAADLRAPTPSAAAERAVPERAEHLRHLAHSRGRLVRGVLSAVAERRLTLRALQRSYALGRPRDLVAQRMQTVDELERRLGRAVGERLARHGDALGRARARLGALSPSRVLQRGFCYVESAPAGLPVASAAALSPGDAVRLVFRDGRAGARVETVEGAP